MNPSGCLQAFDLIGSSQNQCESAILTPTQRIGPTRSSGQRARQMTLQHLDAMRIGGQRVAARCGCTNECQTQWQPLLLVALALMLNCQQQGILVAETSETVHQTCT